jgi:hypothetical protein
MLDIGTKLSMTLEIIKRLFTVFTPVKRLACRTAELADQSGMIRMTMRTADGFFAVKHGRMANLLQG